MAGNHSRAWHDANTAVDEAQRAYDDAKRFYGDDSNNAWRINDAATALTAARNNFNTINRDPNQAWDQS